MNIVIPVALVVIVGLLASVMLSYASKVFAVQEDQLFLDLRAELPGANCGGCGYAGCDDYAHAMAEGEGETPCTKWPWRRAKGKLPAPSVLSAVPQ